MPDNLRYPPSTFRAEYPYNQATLTRSGHEIHINDTPGSESIKISHRAGTFTEINETGRLVTVVAGKTFHYYKDSLSETIDGHRDTKISGSLSLNADNSISMQTAGDWSESSMNRVVGSSHYSRTTLWDTFESTGRDRTTKVGFNDSESVGLSKVTSSLKRADVVGTVHTMSSGVGTEIMSGGTIRLSAATIILDADIIITKAKATTTMTSGGATTINAGGAVSILSGAATTITTAGLTTITSGAGVLMQTPLGLIVNGGTNIDLNVALASNARVNTRRILTA